MEKKQFKESLIKNKEEKKEFKEQLLKSGDTFLKNKESSLEFKEEQNDAKEYESAKYIK